MHNSPSMQVNTALGRLHLRLSGSGPVMLCWPSLLMDGRMWQAQAAHFSPRYRVVCIDPPGAGDSEPLKRHFTLEECALVVKQILDVLKAPDCVLLGNSWGGMMGGVFAALYPERLRAAVLMNCTASPVGWAQKLEFLTLAALVQRSPRFPPALVTRAVKAFAGDTSERTQPEVIAFIRNSVSAVNPRSSHWAVRSVVPYRRDHRPLLSQVTRPVLVVAGEEDRTFPVAETRAMAEAMPGSRFVVLPQVGHLAALEAPVAVNAAIDEFLGGLGLP